MIDHNTPTTTDEDVQPQNYLRIPGLVFDDVPALIPQAHSAALRFLQPADFDLGMSYGEYYELLEPFDRVAHRLVDVFDYCVQVFRRGPGVPTAFSTAPYSPRSAGAADSAGENPPAAGSAAAFWGEFFDRVLDHLGPTAEAVGLCSLDVMWIVHLYTRAWQGTGKARRAAGRAHWRRANIRHLHDLLEEWFGMLRARGVAWTDVFGELFEARR
ncbi:hypothetical protein CH63R_03453 [Colletotrichum higginsianum IMI 349063]|uniref:Uncharacterized protein n=2 Tax=Colletotrichum higginsianum TaxID=80884 RepID=A0A1B7YRQ9_COLHI|nr:hypothetical protein CH63R_03453 [Colletotrichum higginsianum IMI 349063]OBR14727.1 hypothetical protein CH63R_03453 [Colletotrichum higginsianum IMI 349063]TID01690.1 hypothetical protein CH35J_004813 [Colletotrichum higginsianum]